MMVTTTETVLALPAGAYDAVSLRLPEGLTFEQWVALGSALKNVEASAMFWIGDWLAHGEHFGEQAHQYIEGYSYKTVANARYVARQIPPSRRRENLSYSHHAEVAAMDEADQDYWLSRAANEGLSTHAMRAAIKGEREAKDEKPKVRQRQPRQESPALLKAANGRDCIRCGSPDAVAAHYSGIGSQMLGKGTGTKCHDIATAELCDTCHKEFDQYADGNDYERAWEFLMLIMRTIVRRIEEGDLKVTA